MAPLGAASYRFIYFLIHEGRDLTMGWTWASMYTETHSMDEEKETTIGQPGLPQTEFPYFNRIFSFQ
jgi:hypothetical protein